MSMSLATQPTQPLATTQLSHLHSRLQEGFASQDRALSSAQQKSAQQEKLIEELQNEARRLQNGVVAKEAQIEATAVQLAELRARHIDLKRKNESMNEAHDREVASRKKKREEYIWMLQESAAAMRSEWGALVCSGGVPPGEGGLIGELVQCCGEIEASVDVLASQPDAATMHAVGVEQHVFTCLAKLEQALADRLPDGASRLLAERSRVPDGSKDGAAAEREADGDDAPDSDVEDWHFVDLDVDSVVGALL